MYIEEEKELIDSNNWTQKKPVKIFWNNNTISEICEKWIFYCNNYAYIRSEELHTHLGELLYTREHKAGLSNKKSCIYVDIDELKMCSDGNDESVFKLKKEYIDMQDKIDNKFNNIYKVIDAINKINYKLEKNISYINSVLCESILFDDSQLRYKINAKIDDTLNFVWNEIYKKNRKNRKNRISSDEVNTDKLKLFLKKCMIYHMILDTRDFLKYYYLILKVFYCMRRIWMKYVY